MTDLAHLPESTLARSNHKQVEVMRACVWLAHHYAQALGVDFEKTNDPAEVLLQFARILGREG